MMAVVDFLLPVDFVESMTRILVINSDMAQLILQSARENQLELNGLCSTILPTQLKMVQNPYKHI